MKKTRNLITAIAITLAVTLITGITGGMSAVAAAESADKPLTLKIGASPVPHGEILTAVQDALAENNIKLEIIEYTDYVQPNLALDSGDLDANFFQHVPYLNDFNNENKTKLTPAVAVHFEPLGLYPGKTAELDKLADGGSIAIPNDTTNEARALLLLESIGLITMPEDSDLTVTPKDIVDNPKKLKFIEVEAALIPGILPDVDFGVINGNFALGAGLDVEDVIVSEDASSIAAQTYANVIAVRTGDEERPEIQALVEAVTSPDVADFINEQYPGVVIPMFVESTSTGTYSHGFVQLDNGTPIWVTQHGSGERAVVFLAGMAVMSPSVEFKPMAERIVSANSDYSAYIIEYPGTGYSPETRNPRTIQNITAEVNEVLDKLGIASCTLIVHSISGVYGLYLAEQHPDKIEGFIGIDISVSIQTELFDYTEATPMLDYYREIGGLPLDEITYEDYPEFYAYNSDYEYSEEDKALFLHLSRNMYNPTNMDEWINMPENFATLRDRKFPSDLPVLLFVAESGAEFLESWVEIHEEMLDGDLHEMILLDGPHELYREHLNDMMPSVEGFLNEIGK